ncbi:putative secreted protein with PEP-CTERM sorting signal [Roseiarcus fermentans]|uniref:Putative secreted protein with PEP-CTERM sorting signal n=1 Tax=Roseiarcus fermentans TaxID=1473586 RepID=A0A366FDZ8_9HYPH|nr:PEP-CTERM sorting domain-containing protein [Roseiarcus fermentans]RBP11945.1 putative secreted protein with PEP-CTERM sorting signal [Roseiarcus fermentans]
MDGKSMSVRALIVSAALVASFGGGAAADTIASFTGGDLVIDTVTGTTLDSASAITLQEFSLGDGGATAASVGALTLPQTQSGANSAISGEYGSASEGVLQLSADGKSLTLMGYGVNAATFNSAPSSTYGTSALGQTTSLTAANQTGTVYTTVPRVVALIGANGGVDTTTALTGVFNTNNPRSVATVDGSSFYVSGQGVTGDGTGGVFYADRGATTATPINANTTTPKGTPNGTANPLLATETRIVEIVNTGSGNELDVSRDFAAKGSPNDSSDIRSLANSTGGLPTSATGLVANRLIAGVNSSGANAGSIDVTNATDNVVNHARNGQAVGHTGNTFVYLSPEQFFFANATTMYVADSGSPKNGSANAAALGDGGLQKWSLVGGVWTLDYDLYQGLNLVNSANANSNTPTAPGVTGLFGLTGKVLANGAVELFATSYGLNELSPSYLYEITDTLSDTTYTQVSGESFTTLYSAPAGVSIRGVSFAPVPEPSTWAMMGFGFVGLGLAGWRRAARRRALA